MNRAAAAIVIYLLGVFGGAALLAPWLHAAVQAMAGSFPFMAGLAEKPFHRFVSRSLLILALAGLLPLAKAMNLGGWNGLGWKSDPEWRSRALRAFGIGFLSLGCLALGSMLAGARGFVNGLTAGTILSALGQAAASGVVVAVMEETLFRGLLLGGLKRTGSPNSALMVSSLIYALVHFFRRVQSPEYVSWHSGFVVLGQMLAGFADWDALLPAFFNLVLVGMILGRLFMATGTLHASVALHAAWVFWLKLFAKITEGFPGASVRLWGTERLVDSWLALGVLAVVYFLLFRRRKDVAST